MPKAKKKGSKKKSTVRRRKVGALALNASSPLVMFGPMVGGFLLGDKINDAIDKALPDDKVGQKAKGMIEGGLGAALVFMKLGKKKTVVEMVAGGVLAGAGVRRLLKEFGVITGIGGYQSVPVVARRHTKMLNGYGKVPVIGNNGGGYKTSQYSLNGALNGVGDGGYQVPMAAGSSNVMSGFNSGSGSGSGLSACGSECMQ